ncbi:hypothetical protein [Georgenia sp. SUBG003]|uniref:hypothetical protein n=1 Tax=Georgenia sp. SUBG003 TaxID=1497974 RepID=UPI0004D90CC8|nr:hypothetical protein DA06_03455 [Georgenia sp. SUBG003]
MSGDLTLSTDLLLTTADSLAAVREEFSTGTMGSSAGLSEAVGHDGLYGRLDSFQSSWEIHRGRMVENLDVLGRTMVTVAEAFAELDTQLADGLGGGA